MWNIQGAGLGVWLKAVAGLRLGWHLQLFDVRGILVRGLIQLAVLTQGLVVHWQRHRLHVHVGVVRDGDLKGATGSF